MIEPPRGPTILIVDEDVGFVWWLGELFSEFGYRSIPALSCRQALSLVGLEGNNLLIIPEASSDPDQICDYAPGHGWNCGSTWPASGGTPPSGCWPAPA